MKSLPVILILFLVACSRPCDSIPETWTALERAESEVRSGSAFTEADWPDPEWWRVFDDEVLDCLIETALENNPQMKIAQLQIYLQDAERREAQALLYPTLDLASDISRVRYSKNGYFGLTALPVEFNQYEGALNFKWALDFWGKSRNTVAAYIGEEQTAIAESREVELILSVSVAKTYFDLQTYRERESALSQRVKAQEKVVEIQRLRVKQKLASELDVLTQEEELSQEREDLIWVRNLIKGAETHLLALVGNFDLVIPEKEGALAEVLPFSLPCTLSVDLIHHRPEITAQIWRIETAWRFRNVAQALFYPDFNLVGLIGLQSLHWNNWFAAESWYGQWGPAVHLPIFEGGALVANLDEKDAEWRQETWAYRQTVLNAIEEAVDAIHGLDYTLKQYEESQNKTTTVAKLFKLTQARMKNRLNSLNDVLLTEVEYWKVKDQEIVLKGAAYNAYLSLISALGGGYDDAI